MTVLSEEIIGAIEDKIEDKIENQKLKCDKQRYKSNLKTIISIVGASFVIVVSVVTWGAHQESSDKLIRKEIVFMNKNIESIDKKLDLILGKKNTFDKISEKSDEEELTIPLDVLSISSPAIDAVCQSK